MSETAVKKEKKKWSTGKKVAVILCSVLLALILIVVSGGLIYLHNYCQVKDYPMKRSLYCCYRGQSYQTEAERYLISLIQKTGL